MRVLLINVDAKFNLAIRKLFRYYSSRGDQVVIEDLGATCRPTKKHFSIDGSKYDKVYVSNIFDTNKDRYTVYGCNDVNIGGIGSNFPLNVLPQEIENLEPWYFPNEDISVGFVTRGCIRNCYFCKVHDTEGYIHKVKDLSQIAQHKKVMLLDNNLLAYPGHMEILQQIIDMNLTVDLNQGLDFRLLNEDNMRLLSQITHLHEYIFAFDDISYMPLENEKIKLIKKYMPKPWTIKYYIYTGPETPLEDTIARAEWCRQHEVLPYITRDVALYTSDSDDIMSDYAAYCNQPRMFKKVTFEDFLYKRHKTQKRIDIGLTKYNAGWKKYLEKYCDLKVRFRAI